jgi:archaellum biogenesis ATPase FlaH
VIEKELEKQRSRRLKSFTNCVVFLHIEVFSKNVIKVDSESSKLSMKQSRQTILSFKVTER